MADKIKIGLFLAKLRKEKKLTQAALAEILHVSNKTVSRWETGVVMPDYTDMIALCALYEIEIQELLAGEYIEKAVSEPEQKESETEHEEITEETLPDEDSENCIVLKPKQRNILSAVLISLSAVCALLLFTCGFLTAGVFSASQEETIITEEPYPEKQADSLQTENEIHEEHKTESEEMPYNIVVASPDMLETIMDMNVNVNSHMAVAEDNSDVDVNSHAAAAESSSYVQASELVIRHRGTEESKGNGIRQVELPKELAGRKLSDEELMNLAYADPGVLREKISTVEDMLRWFNLKDPEIWDSNVITAGTLHFYAPPEDQLKDGTFATDSISISAAWLIQDDYEGLGILYVNGANCMNNICICIPIEEGWFVFDTAAYTKGGSWNGALDYVVVEDLSDLYDRLDMFNDTHYECLNSLSVIYDLDQTVMFYEDANNKYLHETTVSVPISRKGM